MRIVKLYGNPGLRRLSVSGRRLLRLTSGGAVGSLFLLGVLLRANATAQEVATNILWSRTGPASGLLQRDSLAPVQTMLAREQHAEHAWYEPLSNLPGDWATAGGLAIRSTSLPTIAAVGTATGLLLLTDRTTFRASRTFYRNHSFVQRTSDALVWLGEGTTSAGIAAGFGLYGLLGRDDRAVRTASDITEALLATGITVQLFKHISGRQSPQMVLSGTAHWRPFPSFAGYQRSQPSYYSFPSGHIATAMATLTVLADNYPEQRWIRPVGYVLVGGLGVSLVNIRYHWYSDLPLGILLGYTFGNIVASHDRPSSGEARAEGHVLVEPSVGRDGAAITMAWVY